MSLIVSASLQAAVLSAVSNFLAQMLEAYNGHKSFSLDIVQMVQFIVLSLVSTPPNIVWQQYLEDKFPPQRPSRPISDGKDSGGKDRTKTQTSFSVMNTTIKFVLDQTVGAIFNVVIFIVGMGLIKGKSTQAITVDMHENFWPIMTNGAKVWPLVSLFNFLFVPLESRTIINGLAGIGWGIFLSLVSQD